PARGGGSRLPTLGAAHRPRVGRIPAAGGRRVVRARDRLRRGAAALSFGSMKIGRLFPDLLTTLGHAASSEAACTRPLKQLVTLSGARAGALRLQPPDAAAIEVMVGVRRGSPLERWLRERLDQHPRGLRLEKLSEPPPGLRVRDVTALSAALGDPTRPAGRLGLVGPWGPPAHTQGKRH